MERNLTIRIYTMYLNHRKNKIKRKPQNYGGNVHKIDDGIQQNQKIPVLVISESV